MRRFLAIFALLLAATAVSGQQVKVMSFNLRYNNNADGDNKWDLRKEAVVECIKEYGPDIMGTQEGLAVQVEYLDKQLPGYGRVGVAREDGKKSGEYAAVYYNKERFELISSDNSWLSETPNKPSKGWDAACKRVITTAVLKDKKSGKIVHAINTHFDHAGAQARRESPKFVLDRVSQAGDDAVIFTGDLNAGHGSEPINLLLEDGRLKDSYSEVKKNIGPNYTYHGFTGEPTKSGTMIIDYVMYNNAFTAKTNKTIDSKYSGRYVSDHYPVFAKLKYKK